MAPSNSSDDLTEGVIVATNEQELAQLDADFPGIRSVDPEEVIKRMSARFQQAQDLDDLFDALSGANSKSQVGKTFQFLEVEWQPFKAERGIIPLAVCNVVNVATGEQEEFVTTGGMVVQFLRRAQQLDKFPFTARIEGKRTNSGQTALNLVRP